MSQSGPRPVIRIGLYKVVYEVFEGAPSRVTGLYSVGRSFVGPSGLAGVKPLPRCDSPEGRSQEDGATLGHGSRKA